MNTNDPPRRVTVMGLGRFAGGRTVAQHFANLGSRVLITDLATEDQLREPLATLQPLIDDGRVQLRLGEHRTEDFSNTDLVVATPAAPTPWNNPYLNDARAAGTAITTEIRLGLERLAPSTLQKYPAKHEPSVIAVTGTAGKSTTTAMIADALNELGHHAEAVGNIGRSLLEPALLKTPPRFLIVEVSSAQLHWLDNTETPFTPHVLVITNLSENHLDWHGSLNLYYAAKASPIVNSERLARTMTTILGPHVRETLRSHLGLDPHAVDVTESEYKALPTLAIPGQHNRINAALARSAIESTIRVHPDDISRPVTEFPGLPHRLERAARWPGGYAFNDSKCTTPQGVRRALDALEGYNGITKNRTILIAGGASKNANLGPLIESAKDLQLTLSIGTAGEYIDKQIRACGGISIEARTLDSAIRHAAAQARRPPQAAPTTILLSPGCASWDQFDNYEHRGREFARLIRQHVLRVDTPDAAPGPAQQSSPTPRTIRPSTQTST